MLKKIKKQIKDFFKPTDKNVQIKWALYGRIWREIGKPQWKLLALGIVCTIIAAGAEAFTITLVKQVIDSAFIEKSMAALYIIGLQIIAAFGAKGAFTYAKDLIMTKAGLLASASLQKRIYRHIVRMNISRFYGGGIGQHLNYFNIQAGAVLGLVTGTIISIVQNVATLAMMLALMLWYAPQMCAVLLFLVPAIMIPMVLITRRRRKLSRESFAIANDVSQHLNQTMHGMKTIQAFGNEDVETDKFGRALDDSMRNSYKNTQAASIQSPILELMISVGLCMALIFGGHFISSGAITTGDFTAFLLALTAAYKPAKNITSTNGGIQHGLIAGEVLFDFLDTPPEIKDAPGAVALPTGKMSVKLENVHFAYNTADGQVIRGIDLTVAPGTVCALVGPSGGGKTTVFNLIERFYEPQKGKILINGKDIKKYTLNSLRKNIAEVSQDVFLFNGSVADNIKYGMPNATQAQVEAAAKMANAHEFIMGLPKKYNTNVGERGALLSGGQKQRIAIARAVLKDSPILLLDEATSALDTQSEKLIQSALKTLMAGRTTFVIAHRLSTILDADQICVVKDGKIVERGTDAELVAAGGEYKKLRDIQFKKSKEKHSAE
ncbi:MAG: ABC transporter ATP-binding protein/permease [Rickettsiales bacterium]|jgi:subfamily B ATP-binding cassette protein MsbA|nr:ABC transporter ATP-binding protein/permease [Rickettsiales bacterium]